MALPFLLLLAAGGVAAAAAASSSPPAPAPPASSGGGEGPSGPSSGPAGPLAGLLVARDVVPSASLASTMEAAGYLWRDGTEAGERYADPRVNNAPPCDRQPPDELAYLFAVPLGVKGRVAAIRARVEEGGGPGSIVQAMEQSSELAIYNAGLDLRAKLGDKAQWPKLAEGLGIPVSKMVDAEQAFEAAINRAFNMGHLDVTSLFKDIRAAIGGALGDAIAAQVSQIVKGISGVSAVKDAASFIGDVSQAVSVIMPFIKIIVDKAIAIDSEKRKAWADESKSYVDSQILANVKACVERGFPPPWHVLDSWNVAGAEPGFLTGKRWVPTGDQEGAAAQARDALEQAKGLGISEPATAVRRWWAAASMLAADPLVGAALARLNRQRGNYGSDEQVALVGLVVATANALDPWPFVELLYGYANGWSALPTKLRVLSYCGPVGARKGVVANTWILNFADLARCAFVLAAALPKGRPIETPAPRVVKSATPVVGFDARPILER